MKQKTWELYSQILSQEGISLKYSNTAETAYFNLETRVVTIPTFEYMTDDVTQLLVSHEVGHARYSTYTTSEYNEYTNKYKDLFNVVEDSHIENRIKDEFKGLKSIFCEGYKTLHKEGFFNLDEVSLDTLSLISRLNLYAKIGHIIDVPFNGRENIFAVRLKMVRSKNDVISLCDEILEFIEESKEEKNKDSTNESNDTSSSMIDGSSLEKKCSTKNVEEELTDTISSSFNEKMKKYGMEQKNSSQNTTEEAYKNVLHLKTKEVYQNAIDFTKYYTNIHRTSFPNSTGCKKMIKEIKNLARSADIVFQQKKKAEELKNTNNVQIGRLNMKKLSKYKTTDNIFKKVKIMKEGQNHGVVILVDYSSSMDKNVLRDAIIQACIVGEFCKMNDIPFAVIAFGIHQYNYHAIPPNCETKSVAILGHNDNFDLASILYLISCKEDIGGIVFKQADTPTVDGLLTATYIIDGFKKCGVEKTSLYLVTDGFHTNNRFCNGNYIKFSPICDTITIDNVLYTLKSYISNPLNHHNDWIIELMCLNLKLRYGTYVSINFIGDYYTMLDKVSSSVYNKIFNKDTTFYRGFDYDNYLYLWKHSYYFENCSKLPKNLKDGIVSYTFFNNPFIDQYQFFDRIDIDDANILSKSLIRIKRLKIFVNGFIERFA